MIKALALTFTLWIGGFIGGDLQEVAKAAAQHTSVLLPPTVEALPEETAWSMLYAEGGLLAIILAVGVMTLWRMLSKILDKTQQQNEALTTTQVAAITKLGEAVTRVEGAIKLSDMNNQHVIGRLSDTVTAATARLDRHEARLEATTSNLLEHSHRILVLESGSHRILPPVPGR